MLPGFLPYKRTRNSQHHTVLLKIKAQAHFSCQRSMAIYGLSEDEVTKYEEAFRPLDKDGSGVGSVAMVEGL